jgi:hypothetical protein
MKDAKTLKALRDKSREDGALLNLQAAGHILRSRTALRKSRRLLQQLKARPNRG